MPVREDSCLQGWETLEKWLLWGSGPHSPGRRRLFVHALSDANYSFLDACPCDLGLLPMGFGRGDSPAGFPFPPLFSHTLESKQEANRIAPPTAQPNSDTRKQLPLPSRAGRCVLSSYLLPREAGRPWQPLPPSYLVAWVPEPHSVGFELSP